MKKVIGLVCLIFIIVLTSVCHAAVDSKWENGGMTRDEVAATIGSAAAGGVIGAAGSVAAVSAAGSVSGLSAAGIASGLTAIGGSMIGGVVVCTGGVAILVIAGGYGGYRLIRWIKTP